MFKITFSILVYLFLVSGALAHSPLSDEPRAQLPDAVRNVEERAQKAREGFRARREEAKTQFEAKREQFKQELEAKKTEIKQRIEAERAQLEKRLAAIKDEKKRQAVLRIAEQINGLNEKRLKHFEAVLERLEEILGKIDSRADKAESRDLNVSSVRSAMTEAERLIASAREVIKSQSGKTYSLISGTSTDAGLKGEIGNVRQAFHADLKKVEAAVKAARDTVHNAARLLGQIRGVDEPPPAPTSTATST